MKELGIYIHIPFCKTKCLYCDFCSFHSGYETMLLYKNALIKEIESTDLNGYKISSVFIGGGTPTVLPSIFLREILEKLNTKYNIDEKTEITVEANPGTLNKEMLLTLQSVYVNRLSIGLQSANNNVLKKIGRSHRFEDFYMNFVLAKELGFTNINVDLMFSLPEQTIDILNDTLEKLIELKPEHISAYSLTLEDEKKDMWPVVDEETDRKMYSKIKNTLKENKYNQYEISNFARNECYSKHNIMYWECGNYIGYGLNASSYYENRRFRNTDNLKLYLENAGNKEKITEETSIITRKEAMEEFMFLGLRMTRGVSLDKFYEKFNVSMQDIYKKPIDKYLDCDLLLIENGCLKLSDKGLDICNILFTEFLL